MTLCVYEKQTDLRFAFGGQMSKAQSQSSLLMISEKFARSSCHSVRSRLDEVTLFVLTPSICILFVFMQQCVCSAILDIG